MLNALRTVWLLALLLSPLQAAAQTYVSDTPISGDSVQVTVTVSDLPVGGDPGAQVSIAIPPGQGDLLGFFANVSNELLLGDLIVDGPGGIVTQAEFEANAVKRAGPGNNVLPARGWDLGLRLGRPGKRRGALEQVQFTLLGITAEQLTSTRLGNLTFGVRVQSTLGAQGSAKIGLADPEPMVDPGPTVELIEPGRTADGTPTVIAPGQDIFVLGSATGATGVEIVVVSAGNVLVFFEELTPNGAGVFSTTVSALPVGVYTIVATAIDGTEMATDMVVIQVEEGSD